MRQSTEALKQQHHFNLVYMAPHSNIFIKIKSQCAKSERFREMHNRDRTDLERYGVTVAHSMKVSTLVLLYILPAASSVSFSDCILVITSTVKQMHSLYLFSIWYHIYV